MHKAIMLALLVLLCLLPCTAEPGESNKQAVVIQQLRQEMAPLAHNSRGLYAFLARVHRRHLDPQAVLACHVLVTQQPKNSNFKAAFAYTWFRATMPVSYEYIDYQKSLLLPLVLPLQAQATRCRQEALQQSPSSPDVLLETGVAEAYLSATVGDGKREAAVGYLRKAVRLDPAWADARYWLGQCLELLASSLPARLKPGDNTNVVIRKLVKEEIVAYQKADELNPKWHTDCLLRYAFAYGWLKEPKKQQVYLEAYIKANPWFLNVPGIKRWRDYVADEARKADVSAGI